MTVMCLTAEYVSLAGNDLKTFCKKAEVKVDVADEDVTNFASQGWKEVIGGLKSGTLAMDFNDDFAASQLDSILWPLLGTVVAFEVRPTQAAAAVGNPKFTGNVLINGHVFGGDVGSVAAKSVSYPTSGPVARGVS